MRILLDENMSIQLKMPIRGHDTRSVNYPDIGSKSLTNGHPLAAMEDRFDFLITADKSMYARQSLVGRKLRILVLPTNKGSNVLAETDLLVDVIAGVTIDQYGGVLERTGATVTTLFSSQTEKP